MLESKQLETIPVSVIVVTKNEETRIAQCLKSLVGFDEVVVVDSQSDDETCDVARDCGARVEHFIWNGVYPKKRQWCLDVLNLKHDWVFFVDADEVVTSEVVSEIAALFCGEELQSSGYFVRARYFWCGKVLRHGLVNAKLALFDRRCFEYPIINDVDIDGMGEIEGHYQPVLKEECSGLGVGVLTSFMVHDVGDDICGWVERHKRYAQWEAAMNLRGAWPTDPVAYRQFLKRVFRVMPLRHVAAFLHSYFIKFGFLDGRAGFDFARSRARYYKMIRDFSKTNIG